MALQASEVRQGREVQSREKTNLFIGSLVQRLDTYFSTYAIRASKKAAALSQTWRSSLLCAERMSWRLKLGHHSPRGYSLGLTGLASAC
jgi:hypothetical protein